MIMLYFFILLIPFILCFYLYICDMIKPLYDRVLVEPLEDREEELSIITTKNNGEGLVKSLVIATGTFNPETGKPLYVRPGDVVMHGKLHGMPVESDGKSLLLIREKNIEAIL